MATNLERRATMWVPTQAGQPDLGDPAFADSNVQAARAKLWENEVLKTKDALNGSRNMKRFGWFTAVGGEGAAMTSKALLKAFKETSSAGALSAMGVPLVATAAVGGALALFGAGLMVWGEAKHHLNNRSRDRMTRRTRA